MTTQFTEHDIFIFLSGACFALGLFVDEWKIGILLLVGCFIFYQLS